MGDVLDLISLISEHFSGTIAINLVMGSMYFLGIFKIKPIRHPRYSTRYIIFAVLSILLLNLIVQGLGNRLIWMVLIGMLLIYGSLAYICAKKPVLYSKYKLESLKELIQQGYSWNKEDMFDRKPIYLIDFIEDYQYKILKAEHFRTLGKFAEAYEIYNSVDHNKLFEDEKVTLVRKKAFLLYTLGDMTRATQFLEKIKDDNESNYLMLKAMIAENAMDLETAASYLQRALNNTSEENEVHLKAMIYNNYGRLRYMEGNYTDATNYYRLSSEVSKEQKNKELIHRSYQNLIHTTILRGEVEKSRKYFAEYESLIDKGLLNDAREHYNLCIEIARQNSNKKELAKTIINGYKEIRDRLSSINTLGFDVSVLRMMFNHKMNFNAVMDRIDLNLDEYFMLRMPDRYMALKEINIPLSEIQFPHCHKYALIHKKITDYMENQAMDDIESYIVTLKDYEIYQRCQMEKEKIGVLKNYIKPYDFMKVYAAMCDIKDIYQKNRMLIETIFTDLDVADECFALDNLEGEAIKPVPLRKMKEHVELAEDNLLKLNKYPIVIEGNIRLATYFFKLGERVKAKKYFEAFEASDMPIHHFAFWIQRDYQYLKAVLR